MKRIARCDANAAEKNTVAIDWKILVPDGRPVYRCSNCDYRYTSGNPLKLQEAKIR